MLLSDLDGCYCCCFHAHSVFAQRTTSERKRRKEGWLSVQWMATATTVAAAAATATAAAGGDKSRQQPKLLLSAL
jgi:hypothetical protein